MVFNFDKYFYNKTASNDFSDNDSCRMAAYFAQDGLCYVTGRILEKGERELHHRLPRSFGGKDEAENLILLSRDIHRMVHTEKFEEFYILMLKCRLTAPQLALVNQLRYEAHRTPVSEKAEVAHYV